MGNGNPMPNNLVYKLGKFRTNDILPYFKNGKEYAILMKKILDFVGLKYNLNDIPTFSLIGLSHSIVNCNFILRKNLIQHLRKILKYKYIVGNKNYWIDHNTPFKTVYEMIYRKKCKNSKPFNYWPALKEIYGIDDRLVSQRNIKLRQKHYKIIMEREKELEIKLKNRKKSENKNKNQKILCHNSI